MKDHGDDLALERVRPYDLDVLVAASRALFVDEGVEPPGERAHRVTLHRRLQTDAEAILFRPRAGAAPLAFALLSRPGPETAGQARIEQFRVEADQRRRGWGRRCVEALLAGPLAAATIVEVRVLDDNGPAIAFWQALGFASGDRRLAIEPRPVEDSSLRPG
jgi:ribosomal protein S18 acetylase RimI-like enzyme